MPLRLKTKFTLTTALVVLGVVAVTSTLYVATLARQVIRQADDRARFVALQLIGQAQHALADAAQEGAAPASNSPPDLRQYVRQALSQNVGLNSLIEAVVGYSPLIYEVAIVDGENTAFVSSDPRLRGEQVLRRTELQQLARSSFLEQLRILRGASRVYEVRVAFNLGAEPF
ncbi:MAG: hypothetical protein HY237_02885, partial [Acidobacteria bacterium]|nr:hypothetical protein [Acidobacteriota bacterium]